MGIRILVIEDEKLIADFLVRGLREEGFTVERAADGQEGWHALQTGAWDVILLDWWLPASALPAPLEAALKCEMNREAELNAYCDSLIRPRSQKLPIRRFARTGYRRR